MIIVSLLKFNLASCDTLKCMYGIGRFLFMLSERENEEREEIDQ
jgi:hypothetical protein